MSRFYGSIEGQAKTVATRRGGPDSGIRGHLRGWTIGVSVLGEARADDDAFSVAVTGGSNNPGGIELAEVYRQGSMGVKLVRLAEPFGGGLFAIGDNGVVVELHPVGETA